MDTTRRTYTITEAARILGLGRSAAYEAARRGTLPVPVLRIGARMLIPRAPLDRLLAGEGVATEPRDAA